jgi:hypothetical protein
MSPSRSISEKGPSGGRVVRDSAWVEREYGREKWPAILTQINACIASGEISLSRAIATIERWQFGTPDLRSIPGMAHGEHIRLPATLAYFGLPALVAEAVIAACAGKTAAIIELGSGWGRFLFETWLRGAPRAASYHALELTEAGRECVTTLARLESSMQIATTRFDFQKPNFSSISRPVGHAVVFTVSSLHQVPFIDKDAYRAILDIAETIDCLHFEQIGWQIHPGPATAVDRDYAVDNDYNRNLWDLLSELNRSREIELCEVHADIFGSESRYPLSLVHWRKSPSG